MKAKIADRYKKRLTVLFSGMLAVYVVGTVNLLLPFVVLYFVFISKHIRLDTSDWAYLALWAVMGVLCFWAGNRLRKQRQFYLLFGTWAEAEGEEAAAEKLTGEIHISALAVHQAFEDGDDAKAQRIFQKRDGTQLGAAASYNYASVLAQLGDFEALKGLFSSYESTGNRAKYTRKFRDWEAFARVGKVTFAFIPMAICLVLAIAGIAYPAYQIYFDVQRVLAGETKVGFVGNDFEVETSEHFVIYYHDRAYMEWSRAEAEKALQYDAAFYSLPLETYAESKITLVLSDSREELMRRCPAAPAWEGGHAIPEEKCIYIFRYPDYREAMRSFELISHELSHILFHKLFPQLDEKSWLNEGIASYIGWRYALELWDYNYKSYLLHNIFSALKKEHLPFDDFLISYPTKYNTVRKVQLFYTQGFSIAFTLIEYYGKDNFIHFVTEYSIDKDIERALFRTYPKITSLSDLQGIWLLFMT
jgi:hypothetical protein